MFHVKRYKKGARIKSRSFLFVVGLFCARVARWVYAWIFVVLQRGVSRETSRCVGRLWVWWFVLRKKHRVRRLFVSRETFLAICETERWVCVVFGGCDKFVSRETFWLTVCWSWGSWCAKIVSCETFRVFYRIVKICMRIDKSTFFLYNIITPDIIGNTYRELVLIW